MTIYARESTKAPANSKSPILTSAENVNDLVQDMAVYDREHFHCLLLDTKNRLIERVEISVGSLNASIVHPRELYKLAVARSAAAVIVVHNHPSGDTTPSGADIQLTRRLVKAGDVLGIELLDHVIVGSEGFTSLRDSGLM